MIVVKDRICFVVAVEFTLRAFLVHQLRAIGSKYDLTVVMNTQNPDLLKELSIPGTLKIIPLERKISLIHDIEALFDLIRFLRTNRFTCIHSITPKAGLIASIAGFIAGSRIRVHTFTGQVWASRSGFSRFALKAFDRLIATLVTHVLVDSPSQLEFLRREGVVREKKARVLGEGSLSGVNLTRFAPDLEVRRHSRSEHEVSDDAVVFLFVGRLTRDKGVLDLAQAFANVAKIHPARAHLWVVGPDEEGMTVQMQGVLGEWKERVRFFGLTATPETFMRASDVLCLPSYREGFGSVVIEAAAVGIPTIGSRIYGVTDAIVDGRTGLLHTPGDASDLTQKMRMLMDDPSLRHELGLSALTRARGVFSQEVLTASLMNFYSVVLKGLHS
jgi:glycosyltransferase involved in cell wall biosynthesis